MPNTVLYHNPRCSKSRQAVAFLEQNNVQFEIHEYLKNPLTVHQLEQVFNALKNNNALLDAHAMIRKKEAEYKQANLSDESTDGQVLTAIAEYPKLLERPILLVENNAAIGRPLENIEALVGD